MGKETLSSGITENVPGIAQDWEDLMQQTPDEPEEPKEPEIPYWGD